MADDPCSVGDDGFSLFASERPAKKKKKSKSSRKTRGKADDDAVGDVDNNGNALNGDDDDAIEAAPPSTPAASKALAKSDAEARDDEDDAPVTFKSLGLSDWLSRYDFVSFFF